MDVPNTDVTEMDLTESSHAQPLASIKLSKIDRAFYIKLITIIEARPIVGPNILLIFFQESP